MTLLRATETRDRRGTSEAAREDCKGSPDRLQEEPPVSVTWNALSVLLCHSSPRRLMQGWAGHSLPGGARFFGDRC